MEDNIGYVNCLADPKTPEVPKIRKHFGNIWNRFQKLDMKQAPLDLEVFQLPNIRGDHGAHILGLLFE